VKNAERIYTDPSTLRALYVHETRSAAVCRWRSRLAGALPVTSFGKAELLNAIALAAFRRDLTPVAAEASRQMFVEDLAEGRLCATDLLWRAAMDRCMEISRRWTPTLGTRMLDALHVASALEMGCTVLASHDQRQLALARACGLKTLSPAT